MYLHRYERFGCRVIYADAWTRKSPWACPTWSSSLCDLVVKDIQEQDGCPGTSPASVHIECQRCTTTIVHWMSEIQDNYCLWYSACMMHAHSACEGWWESMGYGCTLSMSSSDMSSSLLYPHSFLRTSACNFSANASARRSPKAWKKHNNRVSACIPCFASLREVLHVVYVRSLCVWLWCHAGYIFW